MRKQIRVSREKTCSVSLSETIAEKDFLCYTGRAAGEKARGACLRLKRSAFRHPRLSLDEKARGARLGHVSTALKGTYDQADFKRNVRFLPQELSKASMTRHLQACPQRDAIQSSEGERHQLVQRTSALHLLVEGFYLKMYWMHLAVAADATLVTLDDFLRATWLECCGGHLSAFEIAGVHYYDNAGMMNRWSRRTQDMQARLESVLNPGQTCLYSYDFGTTTQLMIRVLAPCELSVSEKRIHVLARNSLPIPCDLCGKSATSTCRQCASTGEHYFCDECSEKHPCGQEHLFRVVNSPRAGVCGYPCS